MPKFPGKSSKEGKDKQAKKPAEKKGKRKSAEKGESRLLSTPAVIMGPRLMVIAAVVILCVLGLVMIYSSSSITAYAEFGDSMFFFKRQLVFLTASVIACVVLALIPYDVFSRPAVSWGLWGITAVLLLVVMFAGNAKLGATRSITVGPIDIQPAEFAKVTMLLLQAALLERFNKGEMPLLHYGVAAVLSLLVTVLLIYKQPDLGTAMIMLVGVMVILMLGSIPWYVLAGVLILAVGYFVLSVVTQSYHQDRIRMMFDPWSDALGDGYQSVQGLLALGSGGFFGTGIGLSRQKYLYLPYAYNDFIYAVIGEELGLVGAVLVLLLFGLLIYAGLRIARNAPSIFGALIAGSMSCMIGFQGLLNMAMIVGLAPVTGKALPFISYGGSSLLSTMIMAGLIISVSVHSSLDARYEERRDDLLVVEGGRSKNRQAAASQAPAKGSAPGFPSIPFPQFRQGRGASGKAQQLSRGTAPRQQRHEEPASSYSRSRRQEPITSQDGKVTSLPAYTRAKRANQLGASQASRPRPGASHSAPAQPGRSQLSYWESRGSTLDNVPRKSRGSFSGSYSSRATRNPDPAGSWITWNDPDAPARPAAPSGNGARKVSYNPDSSKDSARGGYDYGAGARRITKPSDDFGSKR